MTPWTVARQAPLSMEFSRQGCWRGLPCPSSGDLPSPGIKSRSPLLQADSLPSGPPEVILTLTFPGGLNWSTELSGELLMVTDLNSNRTKNVSHCSISHVFF